MKNIHIQYILSVAASALLLRSIFPFDMSSYYERHAFYRKQLWCFSTFRTKNIHIYLVCCSQSTLATNNIPFRASVKNRMRFIENISGVFPHLERRIYTYILCCYQSTLATIDIPFRASITSGMCFVENISGHVFPHLKRRIYTYILCVTSRAHLLRSIFPFEQILRTARDL